MSLTANEKASRRGSRRLKKGMPFAGVSLGLAVALILVASASPALAISVTASGSVSVDGGSLIDIPVAWSDEAEGYGIGAWNTETHQFSGFSTSVGGAEGYDISITGYLKPDPQISWGVTVTDFGAPSNFNFFFSTPIVVGPGPTSVDASISGGITDSGNNGVTITPILADFDGDGFAEIAVADVGGPTTNMGVDVGLGQTSGPPSGAYTYTGYAAGPQAGPAGPWTNMSVTVGFQLSGGADIASLTGFAQILPVPEPGSVVLLAISMLSVVLLARRHRAK